MSSPCKQLLGNEYLLKILLSIFSQSPQRLHRSYTQESISGIGCWPKNRHALAFSKQLKDSALCELFFTEHHTNMSFFLDQSNPALVFGQMMIFENGTSHVFVLNVKMTILNSHIHPFTSVSLTYCALSLKLLFQPSPVWPQQGDEQGCCRSDIFKLLEVRVALCQNTEEIVRYCKHSGLK